MLPRSFFILLIFSAPCLAKVIQIEQGEINGTVLNSRSGTPFDAFFGIPYAVPPVGILRFQAPRGPAPSWNGTRQASQPASKCSQADRATDGKERVIFGSEDCLYLNVFTHNTKPAKLVPVLVYIHGGGFAEGSGDIYGPQYFMDKNVVVVTVNSRLGIFGFFSSGDEIVSGNWGMKDQVEALKWIQKNIHAFGGDPSAVTLEGQSSGGASVHLHTLSPLSKGLFHRVIMQSGTALHSWSCKSQSVGKSTFIKIAQCVGCHKPTTEESLICLKAIPMVDLKKAELACAKKYNASFMFSPIIESKKLPEAFITAAPRELPYQDKNLPAIIGCTSEETIPMALRILRENPNLTLAVLNKKLPSLLHYEDPEKPDLTANITRLINEIYFPEDGTSVNPQGLCELLSDVMFRMWMVKTIHAYPGPKYAYVYDYNNSRKPTYILNNHKNICSGAAHGSDLVSLFLLNKTFTNASESDADRDISEKMITYWVNFITTGNPNTDETPVAPWKPVVNSQPNEYLDISKRRFITKSDIAEGREKFWDFLIASQPNVYIELTRS